MAIFDFPQAGPRGKWKIATGRRGEVEYVPDLFTTAPRNDGYWFRSRVRFSECHTPSGKHPGQSTAKGVGLPAPFLCPNNF
jgi:hypothetical protein